MACPSVVQRPDRILTFGVHRSFHYLVTHNGMGFRCGYILIPPGHPWFCKGDSEIDADVHGGLTFASFGLYVTEYAPRELKRAADEWWIGFDCCHGIEAQDPSLPRDPQFREIDWSDVPGGTIPTEEYVVGECIHLCEQAATAARASS